MVQHLGLGVKPGGFAKGRNHPPTRLPEQKQMGDRIFCRKFAPPLFGFSGIQSFEIFGSFSFVSSRKKPFFGHRCHRIQEKNESVQCFVWGGVSYCLLMWNTVKITKETTRRSFSGFFCALPEKKRNEDFHSNNNIYPSG